MVDTTAMIPVADVPASGGDQPERLFEMGAEAERFLTAHRWCGRVTGAFLAWGVAGVLAVFYFEIEPASPNADDAVWVIVGDVPPAYMDVPSCPTPLSAVDAYATCMEDWANDVLAGRSVAEDIPVYYRDSTNPVPATPEMAEMVLSRMGTIGRIILPAMEEDLNEARAA